MSQLRHLAMGTAATLLTLLQMGCATPDQKTATASSDHMPAPDSVSTNRAADRVGDHVVISDDGVGNATILFAVGHSMLSKEDRKQVRDMVEKAHFDSSKNKVELAVWSDKMYPTDGGSLTYDDRRLAADRADQIKAFLKDNYNITQVEVFNMAEKSNWLARAFDTQDAELKSMFSKDAAAPLSNQEFKVIKGNGFSSRAVLVVSQK